MNTAISYSYRDASNYKQFETVVVQGQIQPSDVAMIMSRLNTGTWFLPHQVGLESLQQRFGYLNEDDHYWHELLEDGIQPTSDEPTISLTAEQLVAKFESVTTWDERTAHDLLWYSPSE